MRDLDGRLSAALSIAPSGNRTASINGSGVDLANYDGALAVVHLGTITDGTWTPSLEESDDNSNFTAVAAGDISGSFTAATSSTDETVQQVAYLGDSRYIRVVITETVASTTGAIFSALVVRSNPRKAA